MEYETRYGTVPLQELIRVYELHRGARIRHQNRRLNFLQSEQGKEYNRARAAAYYERHKEAILEKRKETYQLKKQTPQENA
jgi:hypothetical protein